MREIYGEEGCKIVIAIALDLLARIDYDDMVLDDELVSPTRPAARRIWSLLFFFYVYL